MAEERTAKGLGAISLRRHKESPPWSLVTCGFQISTHSVDTEQH